MLRHCIFEIPIVTGSSHALVTRNPGINTRTHHCRLVPPNRALERCTRELQQFLERRTFPHLSVGSLGQRRGCLRRYCNWSRASPHNPITHTFEGAQRHGTAKRLRPHCLRRHCTTCWKFNPVCGRPWILVFSIAVEYLLGHPSLVSRALGSSRSELLPSLVQVIQERGQ